MSRTQSAEIASAYPACRMNWSEPQERNLQKSEDAQAIGLPMYSSTGHMRSSAQLSNDIHHLNKSRPVQYNVFDTEIAITDDWHFTASNGIRMRNLEPRVGLLATESKQEPSPPMTISDTRYDRQDPWGTGGFQSGSYMTFGSLPSPRTLHSSPRQSSPEDRTRNQPMLVLSDCDGMQPPTASPRSSVTTRMLDRDYEWPDKADWTAHENKMIHDSFDEGSALWIFIADQLPGRSAEEIRQHWMQTSTAKSLIKPVKLRSPRKSGKSSQRRRSGGDELSPKLGRWDPDEDEQLLEAMRTHNRNWSACAKTIPGRDGKQCRARWMSLLVNTGRQQWAN